MKTDTLREMFQSNFSAAARLSLMATKVMRLRKQGRIVNIGWVFADRCKPSRHRRLSRRQDRLALLFIITGESSDG